MWRDEEEKAGRGFSCSQRERWRSYLSPSEGLFITDNQNDSCALAASQQLQVMIETICSADLITTPPRRHKLFVRNKTVNKGGDEGGAALSDDAAAAADDDVTGPSPPFSC